jgi:hypothetical protein
MPLSRKDKEFAVPLVSVLDTKTIDLERALVNFLIKLKYGLTPTVRSSPRLLTVRDLTDLACSRDKSAQLRGFADHETVVYKWLESDLLDLVFRGHPVKENLASARPLHLNAFRLRNPKHCSDYGASNALYNLLIWEAEDVLKALHDFFAEGLDTESERYDGVTELDLETTLLLRLADDSPREQPDPKRKAVQAFPLCIAQARVLADDLRRLLAYKDQVPRSVMIEYLKNAIGLHLGLTTLRLFQILPGLVEMGTFPDACTTCHQDPNAGHACAGCPFLPAIVVDLGDNHRTRMAELARRSVRIQLGELSRYIKAHMVVRKLWEYAEHLVAIGRLQRLPENVPGILALRGWPDDLIHDTFFSTRIGNLIDTEEGEEPDARLQEIRRLGLPPLETYTEMLYLLRQRFHTKYYTQLLDSMLQKNGESALMRQGRGPINQRRFTIGSSMLETLAQLAVLKPTRSGFESEPMLVDDFLELLRDRYGIFVGELPGVEDVPPEDLAALRANRTEFKRRLREIGFYTDLSDAYIAQTIRPRYQVEAKV